MLEYGINRTGKIVEIEPVDQDIVRWIGKFDQGDPNQNFFTITQSQKTTIRSCKFLPRREIIRLKLRMVWDSCKRWMRVLQIRSYTMIILRQINGSGREKKSVRSLSVRI